MTTAFLLSKDQDNEITVAAKHMPGDYDIEYCSPWAGANYMPYVMDTYVSTVLLSSRRFLSGHMCGGQFRRSVD